MKLIAAFLLFAVCLPAVVSTPGYVPNSDTAITTSGATLLGLHLNNKSASPVECVIKDRSTNCGGGACSLFGPATLGASGSAGSVVSWAFNSMPAPNGIQWSCSAASAVVGSISYII